MWTVVVVGLGTYNNIIHDNNIMTENIRILRITIIYSLLTLRSHTIFITNIVLYNNNYII